jgi:hypothetical protein
MKRVIFGCIVLLLAVVVAQADQLVKNGSFEFPYAYQESNICGATIGTNTYWWNCNATSAFPDIYWTIEWADTPGSVGILEFWRGTPPWPQNVPPQEGQQLVELDSNSRPGTNNTNVRIYESIATCPGAKYDLSYYYRSRFTSGGTTYGMSVLWAEAQVASHTGVFSPWQNGTASLLGKFGSAKLEFVGGGTGDGIGMLLDNVSLTGSDPAVANACTMVSVKPYGDSINVCSQGTVPVAIWGSATFDVGTVDPALVMLGGAQVNVPGKTAKYQCSISDSGSPGGGPPDGYPDLTCHFVTAPNMFQGDATSATVSMTVCQDGFATGCADKLSTSITATDAVRIVKDGCQ